MSCTRSQQLIGLLDVLAVGEDWKDIVRTHKEPNHERMFIPHIAGDAARTYELDGAGM
jgi:hypothetical protein